MKRSIKIVLLSLIMLIVFTTSAFAQSLLSMGMRGNEVKDLQNDLNTLHYSVGSADGIFGQRTKQGVMAFQSENGLKVDGIAGPNTFSIIENKLKKSTSTTPISSSSSNTLKYGMRGNSITALQKDLKTLNYSVGTVDGVFGSQTKAAVKAFQKDNKLKVDGIAGSQTLSAIKNLLNGKDSTLVNRGSVTTTQSKVEKVIASAKTFIGVPYVFGGTTPKGFDCSGYTQYVMNLNGLSIPRTTESQYEQGTAISRSNLKLGDFVFFETYKAGPSHVGIYVGENNFINASSSQGVTISSLNNSYWNSRYIGARRIIK